MKDNEKNFCPPIDRHSETCHTLVPTNRTQKKRFIEVNVYENHSQERRENSLCQYVVGLNLLDTSSHFLRKLEGQSCQLQGRT